MKLIPKIFAAVLAGFAETVLACRAEFGDQLKWPGLTAAASLNHHQYGVVRFAAATTVNICSEVLKGGALKGPIGILQNKPYANEAAEVCWAGLSKVFAGGTITAGAPISYDGSGHVIDAVSGDVVIGRAMEAATTAGEKVTAMIFPPIKWADVA